MNYPNALVLAAAMTVLPAAASAQPQWAFAAEMVHLRAGPGMDFPSVARLEEGAALAVQGCLQDYSWCDVVAGPNRGWVYSGYIVYPYRGTYVPVIDYGAALGFGVVTFIIGSYWHDHYFARPWYGQLPRWRNRPPRVHQRSPHKVERPVGVFPLPAYGARGRHPGASVRPTQRGRSAGAPARPAYGPFHRPSGAAMRPTPPRMAIRGAGTRPGAAQGSMPALAPFQRQAAGGSRPTQAGRRGAQRGPLSPGGARPRRRGRPAR